MADLRFGTYLAPNMKPVYQAIVDEIGTKLGLTTVLTVETDYDEYSRDVIDVCFICSLPHVAYERNGRVSAVPFAAPVLSGNRYGGKPIYFSDVIAHKDSEARSFLDLRGKSWSFNEPLSQSGYGITRYHLVSIGETDGFFGEVIDAGFHQESIRLVAAGEVDASAIDSQVLAIEMRDHPEIMKDLKVIDTLGPSTIQPVTISRRIPKDIRDKVLEVLVNFHTTAKGRTILALGNVERWVPVGPDDFDDVRAMLDACAAADFLEIR